jgi:SpoVK/Ycf46/Vps4 family AAA+-type ATPase
MEDNVISLFSEIHHTTGTQLLLVDDLDDLIGQNHHESSNKKQQYQANPKSHASSRTLASFLVMMDSSRDDHQCSSRISLIGTTTANLSFLDRFDHVHTMEPPNDLERTKVLVSFLGLRPNNDNEESILMTLVSATAGMSYAEISQRCNYALMNMDDNQQQDTTARLLAMKESLQSLTAAGLSSHIVDGYVNLRVTSGRELIRLMPRGNPEECPLLGHPSELAWKELEWYIVIPMSRAAELSFLTHGQEEQSLGRTSLCGGVLLTGIPGSGKSTLSRHCAMFAASFLPSVKLIEVSCSSMIHKEVGSSEQAIHRLFDFARSAMPCIVVLDDIAIISSVRGKDTTKEGTMDRVLSTLLHEMDGVANAPSAGMAIIGVTNNVAKVDPALLRPGRLGRTVSIGLPDKEARRQIAMRELENNFGVELLVSASDKFNASLVISDLIAERTEELSGASVVALVRDAKLALAKALLRSENNGTEDSSFMEEYLREYIAKYQ